MFISLLHFLLDNTQSNWRNNNKSIEKIPTTSYISYSEIKPLKSTSLSDLEKEAIHQYFNSDEEDKYNILEREAQEQYN